ncbi:MAG: Chemotaxis protein methyltransferase CheR, partial [uncultured Gemmatimonadetes bacterium]
GGRRRGAGAAQAQDRAGAGLQLPVLQGQVPPPPHRGADARARAAELRGVRDAAGPGAGGVRLPPGHAHHQRHQVLPEHRDVERGGAAGGAAALRGARARARVERGVGQRRGGVHHLHPAARVGGAEREDGRAVAAAHHGDGHRPALAGNGGAGRVPRALPHRDAGGDQGALVLARAPFPHPRRRAKGGVVHAARPDLRRAGGGAVADLLQERGDLLRPRDPGAPVQALLRRAGPRGVPGAGQGGDADRGGAHAVPLDQQPRTDLSASRM